MSTSKTARFLYVAGWLTNKLPTPLAMLMPEPVLRAAYQQIWRQLAEL